MNDTPNCQFKVGDTVIFNSPPTLDKCSNEGRVVKINDIYERDGQTYINFDTMDIGWYIERFQLYGESIVSRILTKYGNDL